MTPLALFLARNIRLDRGVRVTQVTRAGGALTVVAEDVDRKNKGNIALRFTEGPIALDGWTITDARGARVTVRLEAFARTAPFAPDLFKLEDPRPRMVDPALAQ
jgi:outer membrane lipoprotein-sorting protein